MGGHGERHQTNDMSKETSPSTFHVFALSLFLLCTKKQDIDKKQEEDFQEILSDDEFLFGVSCDGGSEESFYAFLSLESLNFL